MVDKKARYVQKAGAGMPAENMGTARGSAERRALNMIWTAAGDYSLAPGFVSYLKDGTPDLYFNTIMGN